MHCISDGSNKNPSNPVTPSESSSGGGGFGGGANNAAAWADIAPEGKAWSKYTNPSKDPFETLISSGQPSSFYVRSTI